MNNVSYSTQQGERWIRWLQNDLHTPQRPWSVILLAGAVGVLGVLYLLLMLLYLSMINLLASLFPSPLPSGSSLLFPPLSIETPTTILVIMYLTFLACAYLCLARSFYLLKQWAYWGLLAVEGFNVLVALIILLDNHNGTIFFTNIWLPLLMSAALLSIGKVRRAFRIPF